MKSSYVELYEIGKSRVVEEEIETSNLKANEAIIKLKYSMISAGTELSRAFAIKKGFKYPVRPGYCGVGEVLQKGENINAEVGDYVFVSSYHASLVRWSDSGKTQGNTIIKLPKGIDLKEATVINLLLVALSGVNLTNVKMSDKVCVFGLGNIGIITALMYQKLGCDVLALDLVKERCDLAKNMGIKYVSSDEDQLKAVNEFTNNKGADITVDVTGISPAIISAIDSCKKYGQVLLLGSPRQGYECDITPVFNKIHMKNLTVLGGFNETAPVYPCEGSDNSVIKNFNRACELIINKDIDVSKLITKIIDPKECESAYYDLMYNKNKVNCVIFDWTNY